MQTIPPRPHQVAAPQHEPLSLRLWVALFALALAPLCYALATEKFFSADGAHYFRLVLDTLWFTTFDWSRGHAVYLTQWPVVVSLLAGVTEQSALEVSFAAGLLLPHVLGFALCLVALRGLPKWPLLFPIASLLTITLASDAILVGEHHPAAALAWPICFFAIRGAGYERWEIALIALLLLVDTRLYTCTLVTGPLFAWLFLRRSAQGWNARWTHGALAALSLVGAGIALLAVLEPRDPVNRQDFILALKTPLTSPFVQLAVGFLIPFLASIWLGLARLVWTALVAGAIVVAVGSVVSDAPTGTAGLSFACRTLTVTLLPLMLVTAAWLVRHMPRFDRAHAAVFAVFVATAVLWAVYDSRHWTDFRRVTQEVLRTQQGFVAFEATPLAGHPSAWNWTNPTLSYLWSDGHVRCIILNPLSNGWQPFDPVHTVILRRYMTAPAFVNEAAP